MKKGYETSTEATEDLTILDFLVGGWCFDVGATKPHPKSQPQI